MSSMINTCCINKGIFRHLSTKILFVGVILAFLILIYTYYTKLSSSYNYIPKTTGTNGIGNKDLWQQQFTTHRESLVDWAQVRQLRMLKQPTDWSKVTKRPQPPATEMHDNWIVVTSIAGPTKDVEKLANIKGWQLLVVGDTKTPDDWSLANALFLSVKKQRELAYRTVEVMPYKNYARKTIGHLYAIEHGAKMIYETDDDTYPYDGQIKFHQAGTGEFLVYDTTRHTVNPYAHFGQATIWPRGYPLEDIANPPVQTYVKCGDVKAVIQQGVVDGDPDVDAVFRLSRKDTDVQLDLKFDPKAPPVLIPPGSYTPYNCQNTLHLRDAFWGLVLPPSGTLRVTDIWRSFFVQRLLQEVNMYLGYFGPTAYQVRNAHNYLQDFIDEEELYYKSGRYIKFLEQWKAPNVDFFNRVQMLAVALVTEDIWKPIDAVTVNAYLEDIVSFGYQAPEMKRTTRPCAHVLEASKELKFQQQPSAYLRIGKDMKEIIAKIKPRR